MSDVPPGTNGTINLTGLLGQLAAHEDDAKEDCARAIWELSEALKTTAPAPTDFKISLRV
jgi:hypothetical protein